MFFSGHANRWAPKSHFFHPAPLLKPHILRFELLFANWLSNWLGRIYSNVQKSLQTSKSNGPPTLPQEKQPSFSDLGFLCLIYMIILNKFLATLFYMMEDDLDRMEDDLDRMEDSQN